MPTVVYWDDVGRQRRLFVSSMYQPADGPTQGSDVTQQMDRVPVERRSPGDRRVGGGPGRRHALMGEPTELRIAKDAWETRHGMRLAFTDLLGLITAVAIAMVTKFGADDAARTNGPIGVTYTELGAIIVGVWWLSLIVYRTRDQRLFGDDAEEFRRVVRATVFTFSLLAIVSLITKADMSRGYLAMAFPIGIVLLLASRLFWRFWLRKQRLKGRGLARVLMIGGVRSSTSVARTFEMKRNAGFRVTGVWVPDRHHAVTEWLDVAHRFIPVLGTDRSVSEALEITDANTVILTDTEHLGHDGLRDLMWQLERAGVDLMVSPNVVDVAGARLHMRGIAGMSLLHLEEPQYAAAGRWRKALFDRVGAGLLLFAFSPILVAVAVAVRITSPGEVFFHQERIGRDGTPFKMIKFRSMRIGADAELRGLLAAQGTDDRPLFKVQNDPRITKVGAFLRRFSLDEIPQLINVVKGDMSLVGPRPQQAAEVELYDDAAHRRLHVRPGMTGLWQVSGRSDLSWEDAIRLDISYVENWSMTADLMILWRTVRAVVGSDGAY